MFLAVFAALLLGYPVALTLAGVGLLLAFIGSALGQFALNDLGFLPGRLFGIVTNQTLIAVPLFVFMGVTLERTRIAENLLASLTCAHGWASRRARVSRGYCRRVACGEHRHRGRYGGHTWFARPSEHDAGGLQARYRHWHNRRYRNAGADHPPKHCAGVAR